jgi:hypothetical protein
MEIPLEFIALIGIVLGLIGRTLIPYFKKVNEDPNIDFDGQYVLTMIFSGVVTAIFVFPLFVIPEESEPLKLLVMAFIFAWTANDVTNRLSK